MTTPTRVGITVAIRRAIFLNMHLPRARPSRLDERAVVELPVEPVGVARDVLLQRDVEVGLEQRNARDLVEGLLDEALHILLVGRPVAAAGRSPSAVDHG